MFYGIFLMKFCTNEASLTISQPC